MVKQDDPVETFYRIPEPLSDKLRKLLRERNELKARVAELEDELADERLDRLVNEVHDYEK